MHHSVRFSALTIFTVATACGVSAASAQSYPTKPIRLIVNTTSGGSPDMVARLVGHNLAQILGQQVVVDNRPGASGVVGVQTVAHSAPDGYTLMIATTNFITIPLLKADPPYSPVKDFAPITLAAQGPNILVVKPSSPVTSVSSLIALAKSQPGKLNYATGSSGASPHLAAELFKHMAGVNIVQVSYRGAAQALIDLISGQVDLMFATAVSVAPHLKSGRLKALAITSLQPSPQAPDLPTIAASGLPGYECGVTYGFLAPAGTSSAIVRRLNAEMVKIVQRVDVKEILRGDGSDVVASTADEYARFIKSDMQKWGAVIKAANIRIE